MGTLGSQSERNHHRVSNNELGAFLEDAENLAKKYSIPIETVIEAKRALEMERQNNIAIQSGDHFDEQAAGFGDIFSRIATALEKRRK